MRAKESDSIAKLEKPLDTQKVSPKRRDRLHHEYWKQYQRNKRKPRLFFHKHPLNSPNHHLSLDRVFFRTPIHSDGTFRTFRPAQGIFGYFDKAEIDRKNPIQEEFLSYSVHQLGV